MEAKHLKPIVYFVIDTFLPNRDGNVIATLNLIDQLIKNEFEVYIITTKNPKIPSDLKYSLLLNDPLITLGSYPYSKGRLNREIKEHLLKNHTRAIIHLESNLSLALAATKFAKKAGIPLVATIHTRYFDDYRNIFKSRLIASFLTRRIVRKIYQRVDYLFALSKGAIEQLEPFGLVRNDIQLTTNVSNLLFKQSPSSLTTNPFNFDLQGQDLFLFVGHINHSKNLIFLLDALAIYHKYQRPYLFLLAGEGVDLKRIAKYAKKKGVNAQFLGQISPQKLQYLYTHANLFLFPSLFDTYGLVVDEAAASGLASLVLKDADVALRIIDQVNGFIALNNATDYAAKLELIMSNKGLLSNVQKQVKSILPDDQKIIQEAINFYQKLI